jgi:hypothetical protein
MSGGIAAELSTPADVRHYVGVGPVTIATGDRMSYVFALVGGDNLSDIQTHAVAAREKAATLPAFQGQAAACP